MSAGTFRVLTWNLRSLRDDARGVAAFLRQQQVDIALLQEAPRLPGWQVWCWLLARRCGLRRVVGGGTACGNMLLVSPRVHVHTRRAVRLPRRRGLHRRGAVLATVEVAGCRLVLLGTHLDLAAGARVETAQRLRELAMRLDPTGEGVAHASLLVGADLNEQPGGAAWTVLSDALTDLGAAAGPTFPQRAPRRRIDGLFAGPALRADRVWRPECGAVTDHLPVLADLRAAAKSDSARGGP